MHCHADLIDPMIDFCKSARKGNLGLLAVTTTPKAYEVELKMLGGIPSVYIALGLHPQLVKDRFDELSIVEKYIAQSRFVGEIGLDYGPRYYQSKEQQVLAFDQIISWCQHSKPKTISIHSVRSDRDILDILESYNCPQNHNCIMHWYSGTNKQLERAIELGCYFSINEYMINSKNGSIIIEKIPIDRLLLESDAPFISNIKSVSVLKQSLLLCEKALSSIKGTDMAFIMAETSRKMLEGNLK